MSKYRQLAENIVQHVGGTDNVSSLTHCITRLRFKLKDTAKANTDALSNMAGIVQVLPNAMGQYQVVIGNHVGDVYEEVQDVLGGKAANEEDSGEKQSFFNALITTLSGCFQPFLPILAAGGMIRGLTALLVFLGVFERGSGTFLLLDTIGDTVFMFLPVIIGLTAARIFKVNEFVGLLLGAVLMNPAIFAHMSGGEPIMTLFYGTLFESEVSQTVFGGIPVIARNYASSVIPIIMIMWFAKYVQRFFRNVIPSVVANFLVPFFTVLVVMPIAFVVIGPIFTFATDLLMGGFEAVIDFSPIVYGALIGFFWQILVMFGLHWAVVPMGLIQFSVNGWQNILAAVSMVSFGQTAAVIALYFKIKDRNQKSLAIPAIVSGIVGITEPAIYGFTLPRKRVFIYTCIAGMVGGAYAGMVDLRAWNQGGLGIFTVPNYFTPEGGTTDVVNFLIAIAIACTIAFVLTWFFWNEPEMAVEALAKPKQGDNKGALAQLTGAGNGDVSVAATSEGTMLKLTAPLAGKVVPLGQVADPAFAGGLLGGGVAIEPTVGQVVSPVDGVLSTLFPTKHAMGITSDEGLEVLIHIGMDTVQLAGKYFNAHVEQGQRVSKGQVLVDFDIEGIKGEGYPLMTPVIITNTDSYADVVETGAASVVVGDELLTILG